MTFLFLGIIHGSRDRTEGNADGRSHSRSSIPLSTPVGDELCVASCSGRPCNGTELHTVAHAADTLVHAIPKPPTGYSTSSKSLLAAYADRCAASVLGYLYCGWPGNCRLGISERRRLQSWSIPSCSQLKTVRYLRPKQTKPNWVRIDDGVDDVADDC